MINNFFRFNNYKTNTVCVVGMFVLAFVYARLFSGLRYSDYRHAFFSSVYALHFITVLCSFINAAYILRIVDFKDYKKYYWLVVGSIPILLLAGVIIWIGFL